jgi:urea transport system permease protein
VNGMKTWFTSVMPQYWLFILGAIFVLVTLFLPQGIAGLVRNLWARRSAPRGAARPAAGGAS